MSTVHSDFVGAMEEIKQEKSVLSRRETLQEHLLQASQKLTPELAQRLQIDDRELDNNNDDDSYEKEYMDYVNYDGGYGDFDLTKYALKYVGCQNIHTWSDDRVEAGLTPMEMHRFVVLRLCESDTCSAYNKWGCNFNYGEYVIPMEDYLAIMSNYHFQQYNRYCQTCSECVDFDIDDYYGITPSPTPQPTQTDDYYNNNNGGRRLDNNNDDYYGDDNFNYGYNSNYGYNKYNSYKQLPWYVDDYGECKFNTVCQNYKRACKNNYHPNATYYKDYFTCTAFQLGNQEGYLGPHCRNDGHTIGIGLFEDAYCSSYVGDVADIYQGQSFDDDELSLFYDHSCISCRASDGYSLIKDAYVNDNQYSTYPLCGALYDTSAKCNIHMDSSSSLVGVERRVVIFCCRNVDA